MNNWTKEQKEVIKLRNKNILVSAGAGSGKTSVMVERIKTMIIEDNISIDSILVMTFTKAAAQKMKLQISKAISDAMDREDADIKLLSKQLALLDDANISTFHSFQIKIIKRYFSLIDVSPVVSIGNEKDMDLLLKQTLDEIFEDYLNEENQEFISFLDVYTSVKSDNLLKKNIISFYYSLRAIPYYMEELNSSIEDYLDFEDSKAFEYILRDCEETFEELKDIVLECIKVLENFNFIKLIGGFYDLKETISQLYEYSSNKDFDSIYKVLDNISYPKLSVGKAEKEEFNLIKDEIKELLDIIKSDIKALKEAFFYKDLSSHIEDMKVLNKYSNTLAMIIQQLDNRYIQKKTEKNILDFSDIEHLTLKILENDFVSDYYKEKFNYIFLDEYQDSNFMQEALIEKIKREDNLFMVGDIKQSIYGFRNAEPQLFLGRLHEYLNSKNSEVIYLNSNFRSRPKILKDINAIFERGILDTYTKEDSLKAGANYPEDDLGIEFELITQDKESDRGDLKSIELEAINIGMKIKSLLGETLLNYEYTEGEDKVVSTPIKYSDITILVRTNSFSKVYQDVFKKMGIPSYIKDEGGYYESFEIQLILDILKVTDNKKRDIPLIAVLHSIVFDFSFDDLAKISISNRHISIWNRLLKYRENGEDETLIKKVNLAINTITKWQEIAGSFSVDEYIEYILDTTDIYLYFGSFSHGEQRQNNIKMLVSKANEFSKKSSQGIYNFLKYIEYVIDKDIDFSQSKDLSLDENSVNIMTIHNSKGLDFPVVIVPNINSNIISRSNSSQFSFKKDFGFGIKYLDKEKLELSKNIILNGIERMKRKEEYQEEIRIFYVALTRCEQKLILSCCVNEKTSFNKFKKSTFFDLIHDIYNNFNVKNINVDVIYEYYENLSSENSVVDSIETIDLQDEFNKRLNYTLPESSDIRSKYSVTEYTGKEKLKLEGSDTIFGSSISAREGIINHMVLESIDFLKLRELNKEEMKEYILEIVDKLSNMSLITEKEKSKILVSNIHKFLLSDIGTELINSDEVYKEQPFIMKRKENGTEFIIQGVIDCFFRDKNGSYTLIDYKLSNISSEKDLMQIYSKQLKLYEDAIIEAKGGKVSSKNLYILNQNKLLKY